MILANLLVTGGAITTGAALSILVGNAVKRRTNSFLAGTAAAIPSFWGGYALGAIAVGSLVLPGRRWQYYIPTP